MQVLYHQSTWNLTGAPPVRFHVNWWVGIPAASCEPFWESHSCRRRPRFREIGFSEPTKLRSRFGPRISWHAVHPAAFGCVSRSQKVGQSPRWTTAGVVLFVSHEGVHSHKEGTAFTQLFSGTLFPLSFFRGCPTKNGLPQKGSPFFQGH